MTREEAMGMAHNELTIADNDNLGTATRTHAIRRGRSYSFLAAVGVVTGSLSGRVRATATQIAEIQELIDSERMPQEDSVNLMMDDGVMDPMPNGEYDIYCDHLRAKLEKGDY